jgi:hypothetical protein
MAVTLLGAGAIIAVYCQWEKFRERQAERTDTSESRQPDFSTDKLLAAPDERGSVIEVDTKRFEAEPIAVSRQAEHR